MTRDGQVVASLEADAEIEEAWALEAERRDAELNDGKVSVVNGAELLERLRSDQNCRPGFWSTRN